MGFHSCGFFRDSLRKICRLVFLLQMAGVFRGVSADAPFLASNETKTGGQDSQTSRNKVTICCVLNSRPFVSRRKGTGAVVQNPAEPLVFTLEKFTELYEGHDVDLAHTIISGTFPGAEVVVRGHASFPRALYDVRTSTCNFSISAFTRTAYRNQCKYCPEPMEGEDINNTHACCLEFTQTYFRDGMALAIVDDRIFYGNVILGFLSPTIIKLTSTVILLLVASGHLMWWLERRSNNSEFGKAYYEGIGDGMWWSFVTMTTVGYGDSVPRTSMGRMLAVLWMITGITIFSIFNAYILISIAYSPENMDIKDRDPRLQGKTICTTGGVFEDYIRDSGLLESAIFEESLEKCYELMRDKKADAILYDRLPLLNDVNPMWRGLDGSPTNFTSILDKISRPVEIGQALVPANFAVALPIAAATNSAISEVVARFNTGNEIYSEQVSSMKFGLTKDSLSRAWAAWNFPLDEVYRKPSRVTQDDWQTTYIYICLALGILVLMTCSKYVILAIQRTRALNMGQAQTEVFSQANSSRGRIIGRKTFLNLLNPVGGKRQDSRVAPSPLDPAYGAKQPAGPYPTPADPNRRNILPPLIPRNGPASS